MLQVNLENGCMDDISQNPAIGDSYDVCAAFWVSKIIRSLDKSGVSDLLHIEVNDHNFEQFSFDLPVSDIHDEQSLMGKLAANRLLISPAYKRVISYYLYDEYMHCNKARHIEYRHYGLGWHNHHGDVLFLCDKNDVNGIPSYYAKNNVQFVKGSAKAYENFLRNTVLPIPTLALGLALGYSAVVVSRLKEEYDFGTIIINLCGASSTGKTTIEQLLVSPFASPIPKNGSGLIHTFHATTNALYACLEGINGLPIVLDDATTNPHLNLPNLIYTLATGQGRSRCNAEGDVKEARPSWSGVIVVSSETPIQDDSCQNQGLQVRVLQTQGITWTPDAPTAELIKKTVQKHYGHTGKQFADFVANLPIEKLCALFDESKKNVKRLMVHRDNLSDRLELKYAAIWLTIYLMNKCFGYTLNPQDLMSIFLQPEQNGVVERDISLKALNVMNNYILENYNHFNVCDHTPQIDGVTTFDRSKCASGANYGTIVLNGNMCDVFIPSNTVKDILKKNSINEFSTVKKRWKENGVIACEKDRYTDKDSLNRRCIHFVYPKGLKTDVPDEFYQNADQYAPLLPETPVDHTEWNANDDIDEIFGEFDDE